MRGGDVFGPGSKYVLEVMEHKVIQDLRAVGGARHIQAAAPKPIDDQSAGFVLGALV